MDSGRIKEITSPKAVAKPPSFGHRTLQSFPPAASGKRNDPTVILPPLSCCWHPGIYQIHGSEDTCSHHPMLVLADRPSYNEMPTLFCIHFLVEHAKGLLFISTKVTRNDAGPGKAPTFGCWIAIEKRKRLCTRYEGHPHGKRMLRKGYVLHSHSLQEAPSKHQMRVLGTQSPKAVGSSHGDAVEQEIWPRRLNMRLQSYASECKFM